MKKKRKQKREGAGELGFGASRDKQIGSGVHEPKEFKQKTRQKEKRELKTWTTKEELLWS